MKQGRIGKRIASWLLCMVMVLSVVNLPAFTKIAHAEEKAEFGIYKAEYAPGPQAIYVTWDACPNAESYTAILFQQDTEGRWKEVRRQGIAGSATKITEFSTWSVINSGYDTDNYRVMIRAIGPYGEVIADAETEILHTGLEQIQQPTVYLYDDGSVEVKNAPTGPVPDIYYCRVYAMIGSQKVDTMNTSVTTASTKFDMSEYMRDGYSYCVTLWANSKEFKYRGSVEVVSNTINYVEQPKYNSKLRLDKTVMEGEQVTLDMDIANIDKVSSIEWYYDDGNGAQKLDLPSEQSVVLTETAAVDDAGEYYAKIIFNGKEYYTDHLVLTVTPDPYKCGDNCKYKKDKDAYTVYGTGAIYDGRLDGVPGTSKNVIIEEGITRIGQEAFELSGYDEKDRLIENVTLPSTIKTIGARAFNSCQNLKDIKLPSGIECIEEAAFVSCGLTKVYVPSGELKAMVFSGCSELTQVTFGEGVTKIDTAMFNNCTNLKAVYFEGDAPDIDAYAFYDISGITIYYPEDNATWTEEVRKDYAGTDITWAPYKPLADGWQKIDGKWKLIKDGEAQTGWIKDNGKWYYFDADGNMKTGWVKDGGKWYYMASSGAMSTGWKQISGTWYYFGTNGVMVTGWQKISNKWYYFEDGAMVTGWKKISNKWYYFADGVMVEGWKKLDGKWYYFDGGAMTTGWKKIDNKWYYFGTSGVMTTGWKQIDSKWYYFGTDGVMVSNKTITIDGKKYTFNASGVWVK